MRINDLDDASLQAILKPHTLQRLIVLRAVCTRWKTVIEQICSTKHELCLISKQTSERLEVHKKFKDFIVFKHRPTTKHSICEEVRCMFLPKLVPNITNLAFDTYCEELNVCYPVLLQSDEWKVSVTEMHVFAMPRVASVAIRLVTAVGTLQSLQSLTWYRLSIPKAMAKKKGTFAQVKQLYLYDYSGDIVALFRQLGPNLTHFLLNTVDNNGSCVAEPLIRLLENNPEIAPKLAFTSFQFDTDDSLKLLRALCGIFPDLIAFNLRQDPSVSNTTSNRK